MEKEQKARWFLLACLIVVSLAGIRGREWWKNRQRLEREKEAQRSARVEAEREYAARFLEVGDLRVTKVSDGDERYVFNVLVKNNGPLTTSIITVRYEAPDVWKFSSERDVSGSVIALVLLRDCGPGETVLVGDVWEAVYFDLKTLNVKPVLKPQPKFDPKVLSLKDVQCFFF